jgi:hypothetical protein
MYLLMSEMSSASSVLGLEELAMDVLPYSDGLASEGSDCESDINYEDRGVIGREKGDGSPSHNVNSLKIMRVLAIFQKMLRERLRDFEGLRAQKVRTVPFKRHKHKAIRESDACAILAVKDYSGKLEARKSAQGTSEILGQKLPNHGSVIVMRYPSTEVRYQFLLWSTGHPILQLEKSASSYKTNFRSVTTYRHFRCSS